MLILLIMMPVMLALDNGGRASAGGIVAAKAVADAIQWMRAEGGVVCGIVSMCATRGQHNSAVVLVQCLGW